MILWFKNTVLLQFIKFGIVGVSNTAVNFCVYYLLLWLGVNYLVSNVAAWFVSVLNAFYWNDRYVFQSNCKSFAALLRSYISYGFSMLSGTAFLYLLVEFCGVSKVMAPIFVLVLTIPLNFMLNKFWTFRQKQ